MARLTADMVTARTRQSDIGSVKKLNCWGSDLVDVSILRNMASVEVLALSLNKIASLVDFEECWNLQELYLRKNNIPDLSELCYLQNLPHLKSLWLDENPCSNVSGYRMAVLRALPKLKTLDNVAVTPEEVQEAMSRGRDIYDDNRTEQMHTEPEENQQSVYYIEDEDEDQDYNNRRQPQRKYSNEDKPEARAPTNQMASGSNRPKYNRSPESGSSASPSPRTSPRNATPDHQEESTARWRRPERLEYCPSTISTTSAQWNSAIELGRHGDTTQTPTVTNQVVGNHLKGFHRRPVARNSNLLSAVLCLVKELDYQSLEVLELAVRCRMDEIAD